MTATVRVGVQNGQLTFTAESVDASNPIAQNTVAAIVRQQLEATSHLLAAALFGAVTAGFGDDVPTVSPGPEVG